MGNAMPIYFNTILDASGIPPQDVRLLRHQDQRAARGRMPYRLWRDDRPAFESYQAHQAIDNRKRFSAPVWASFVGTPDGQTLFVGLYGVLGHKEIDAPWESVSNGEVIPTGGCDVYRLSLREELRDLIGVLYIDWGPGTRSWVQLAKKQNKAVVELRRDLKEPDFPGYAAFISQLSSIEALPATWATALAASRGVYLLTCPRTSEQYVGAATGAEGFLGRWITYARTGHGGNIALKSRDTSDYRVSILEVAGSAATVDEILALEAGWKAKLQSREMGLNRN